MKESRGTQSRPSTRSENRDSGTRQSRLTTPVGRSLGTSPGTTPLSARSPVPSRPAKSSCSFHSSGGPTTKSMGTCRLFRLLSFWEAPPTTLLGSCPSSLSPRFSSLRDRQDPICQDSVDAFLSCSNVNPISIILMIPLFDHIIYPALRSAGINYTPIKRIYTGFLVCGLALLYSAVLQKFVYEKSPCHDSHPSGTFIVSFGRPRYWVLTLFLCSHSMPGCGWVPQSCAHKCLGYQRTLHSAGHC